MIYRQCRSILEYLLVDIHIYVERLYNYYDISNLPPSISAVLLTAVINTYILLSTYILVTMFIICR